MFLVNYFSGFGITYKVNSIILQPGLFKDVKNNPPPKRKRSRHSPKRIADEPLPVYITAKRNDVSPLQINENKERYILFSDQQEINVLWLLCRSVAIPQTVSSWASFLISITSKQAINKISIGYLEWIYAPATDISIVYHILERCLKIKETLKLFCVRPDNILQVMEIRWKNSKRYSSCLVMLGIFHTFMMFLGGIGSSNPKCRRCGRLNR